jgi:hypothetical protein
LDRKTLISILAEFLNVNVIKDDYLFQENPRYLSLPEQSHKMGSTAI